MRVDTDEAFASVTWTVDDNYDGVAEHTWIDNNASITSVFSYRYDGFGRNTGNWVSVKATATDADGNSAVKGMTIIVWKPIEIESFTMPSDRVVGQSLRMGVRTDELFHTVVWYEVMNLAAGEVLREIGSDRRSNSNDRYATLSYAFPREEGWPNRKFGSEEGKAYTIRAVAYGYDPSIDRSGDPFDFDSIVGSADGVVNVYRDNGQICREVYSGIYGVNVDAMGRKAAPAWWHDIRYYNDLEDAEATVYGWAKLFEVGTWRIVTWISGVPNGGPEEGPMKWNLSLQFDGMTGESFFPTPEEFCKRFELERGSLYYVEVNSSLTGTGEWNRSHEFATGDWNDTWHTQQYYFLTDGVDDTSPYIWKNGWNYVESYPVDIHNN